MQLSTSRTWSLWSSMRWNSRRMIVWGPSSASATCTDWTLQKSRTSSKKNRNFPENYPVYLAKYFAHNVYNNRFFCCLTNGICVSIRFSFKCGQPFPDFPNIYRVVWETPRRPIHIWLINRTITFDLGGIIYRDTGLIK